MTQQDGTAVVTSIIKHQSFSKLHHLSPLPVDVERIKCLLSTLPDLAKVMWFCAMTLSE